MKSRTKSKSVRPIRIADEVQVQLSLPVAGVLRDVQSAFFGLCVEAGKAVLGTMMQAERTALAGPKGCPDPDRSAYRGGHARSQIVLGGGDRLLEPVVDRHLGLVVDGRDAAAAEQQRGQRQQGGLEAAPAQRSYARTERGAGYVFVAAAERRR